MHLIDFIIIGVILTLAFFAIKSIVKRKGKCDGCSSCDSCSGCAQNQDETCSKNNKDKK